MYVGHVGVALGLRAAREAPPLWALALAAQGPDWLDGVRELAMRSRAWVDLEASNPALWSTHGFVLVAAGALAATLLAWGGLRRLRPALLVGLAWLTHWGCDWVTGLKPTWPGGPWVGLRAFERPTLDLLVEGTVLAVGWALWHRALPAPPPGGRGVRPWLARQAPALLVVALLGLQLAADLVLATGLR